MRTAITVLEVAIGSALLIGLIAYTMNGVGLMAELVL
jgi:hypothetical protein